jgi:hypothetical protein
MAALVGVANWIDIFTTLSRVPIGERVPRRAGGGSKEAPGIRLDTAPMASKDFSY